LPPMLPTWSSACDNARPRAIPAPIDPARTDRTLIEKAKAGGGPLAPLQSELPRVQRAARGCSLTIPTDGVTPRPARRRDVDPQWRARSVSELFPSRAAQSDHSARWGPYHCRPIHRVPIHRVPINRVPTILAPIRWGPLT
jgi:hypothetical protein